VVKFNLKILPQTISTVVGIPISQQLFSHFAAHLLEIKSNPLMDARIGRNFPNNTFDRNFFKVKATKQ
jgi:hypothetical protein